MTFSLVGIGGGGAGTRECGFVTKNDFQTGVLKEMRVNTDGVRA